jgi:hypothetical protein
MGQTRVDPANNNKGNCMNAITMLRVAVALLGVAALGGIVMAATRLSQEKNPPSALALLHGLLAAAGLTLLLYAACTVGIPTMAAAGLALLLIAALVGVVLNQKYQWKAVLLPRGLLLGHAALAVIGFVLLLLTAWRGG